MRIINPKKTPDSFTRLPIESGDKSVAYTSGDRAARFAELKSSFEGIAEGQPLELQSSKKSLKKSSKRKESKKLNSSSLNRESSLGVSDGLVGSSDDVQQREYTFLYQKGIHLLSMREHSIKEITAKLSAKAEKIELVYEVTDKLVEHGYLSNSRFTESYVRAKKNKGFGPVKIRKELLEKGIKHSMVEDFLNAESALWYDNAKNQYTKKYGDQPISDYNSWTKRARFMQSRGFTMEHIHSTLPQVESD